MTTEQIAQALREIDNLTAEARRSLDGGEDRRLAGRYLLAIQLRAQTAWRDVLAGGKVEVID